MFFEDPSDKTQKVNTDSIVDKFGSKVNNLPTIVVINFVTDYIPKDIKYYKMEFNRYRTQYKLESRGGITL